MTDPDPRKRQALKKAWVTTWGGHERADPGAEEHVAELGHRRVGEDLLDVVLHQTDGGGEDRSDAADDRYHQHCCRTDPIQDVGPDHHVDTGGDHRCGVDQGRNRRRSGHGVRQPDIEWDLRGLADRTDEEQQPDDGGSCGKTIRVESRRRKDLGELGAPKPGDGCKDGEEKAEIADAVDDEGLLARGRAPLLVIVVADQEVGAQPDALPADKHDRKIRAENKHQHGEHEQIEIGEVAGVPGIGFRVHVADRVDVDEKTHEGDKGHHHRRQRVELERGVDVDGAGRDPCEVGLDNDLGGLTQEFQQRGEGRDRCGADRPDTDHGHHALGRFKNAESEVQHRTCKADDRNQPQ